MQLATPANTVWPTATPSVAYAQLGDLVEIMLHPKDSVFATCGFCQTLNRKGARRCRACGGSFLPSDESERLDADESDGEQSGEKAATHRRFLDNLEFFSDFPALRSMLVLVLVPPILMFLGFLVWNKLRESGAPPIGLPDRSSIESVLTVPNASAPTMLPAMPRDAPSRHAQFRAESQMPVEKDPGVETTVAAGGASVAEIEERDAQKSMRVRPRPVPSHPAVRVQQGSPIAECSGYAFIARAVCVNRNCAQPRAAQHVECKQANRQRRIDESRRNPVLMG